MLSFYFGYKLWTIISIETLTMILTDLRHYIVVLQNAYEFNITLDYCGDKTYILNTYSISLTYYTQYHRYIIMNLVITVVVWYNYQPIVIINGM